MITLDIIKEFERRFGKTFEIDELTLNRNIQLQKSKELIKLFLTTTFQSQHEEIVKIVEEYIKENRHKIERTDRYVVDELLDVLKIKDVDPVAVNELTEKN